MKVELAREGGIRRQDRREPQGPVVPTGTEMGTREKEGGGGWSVEGYEGGQGR